MTTKELTHTSKAAASVQAAPAAPTVRRYNPFDLLQTEINRVFDAFGGFATPTFDRSFSPSMEVTETDDAIQISTEVPGMDEKDIDISVADGTLTIRGEKKFEKDEKRKDYRLVERSYGSFRRAVALPSGVDPSKIKASMAKGVLTIEAPKSAASKGQQIKISPK